MNPPSTTPNSIGVRKRKGRVWNSVRFGRLKWSMFDSPSKVQVVNIDNEDKAHWNPLFSANDSTGELEVIHPLGNEPAPRMLVVLDAIENWETWADAEAEDEIPAPLVIENTHNDPVTVAQAVTRIHEYAVELRELLSWGTLRRSQQGCPVVLCCVHTTSV
jgi:hypothetical protein